ncbi:Protein ZBED8-like [Oopsacas minuta]|uniref:Protein ZBED8-like n=1 Tax=Oopsacas minuta TaxID=111878 RepID=A0AAV7JFZ3_9METZ|nr:Protein ZBED8-like [Oopsacas minuta]
MNEVNLLIQVPEIYIVDAAERLQALLGKLGLWKTRLEVGNYANFSMLEEVLQHDGVERNKPLSASLRNEMCEHLDTLQNSFTGYFFSGDLKVETLFRYPFSTDVNSIDDSGLAKDDIIDLKTKEMLHCEFNSKSLEEFWCSLTQAYPRLAKRAMKALIPFATIYLCESGFSGLFNIKTKNRNRLDVQHDMCIVLSNIIPVFHLLIEAKQQQSSH